MSKSKKWLPLESNYEILNDYLKAFGCSKDYKFGDIYGFGDEIEWVPKPCKAVVLLFPITKENEVFRKKEEDTYKDNKIPKSAYYIKQKIGNACGTIALLHVLGNNLDTIEVKGKCKEFFSKTKDLNSNEKADFLNDFKFIEEVHEKSATTTKAAKLRKEDLKTWKHFIAFVEVEGQLLELDGRRSDVLNRGKTSEKTFLKDTASVIKKLISITNNNEFAAMYFSKA